MSLPLYTASDRHPENTIRVFPVRTKWTPVDDLSFVGMPQPLSPAFKLLDRKMPVMVSVTFTWHRLTAQAIASTWGEYFDNVQIGGPAFDDAGGDFTPRMFLKDGCTITSRGCPKKCGWCHVPNREGGLRELKIKPGWIVQDNNLLACSEKHLRAVFDMLGQQGRAAFFNGGLDKHFLKDWHRGLFDSIPIGELWFACDTFGDLPSMSRAAKILQGISIEKLRCYTMIGYDGETLRDAEYRLEQVYALGFLPFCQLYQTDSTKVYDDRWRALHRKWARPAAYRSHRVASTDPQLEFATPDRSEAPDT